MKYISNLSTAILLSSERIDWQDVSRAKYAAMMPEAVVTPSTPALKDEADRKPEYPKPDTSQMIPFQPRHLAREYQHLTDI